MVRKKRIPKPIKIPQRLQGQLPFKDKPKTAQMGRVTNIRKQRFAVLRDRHEQKVKKILNIRSLGCASSRVTSF